MKYKDTKKHYMCWSMYIDTESRDIDEWELDLKTDAPDGTYDVMANPISAIVDPATTTPGVVVKDGHFDLYPTMDAVEQAVRKSLVKDSWMPDMKGDFDWVYIEAMDFDPKTKTFIASLGS